MILRLEGDGGNEGGASFADDKWSVRFMLKAGDALHTLIVEVDGKTGKILGSRIE